MGIEFITCMDQILHSYNQASRLQTGRLENVYSQAFTLLLPQEIRFLPKTVVNFTGESHDVVGGHNNNYPHLLHHSLEKESKKTFNILPSENWNYKKILNEY